MKKALLKPVAWVSLGVVIGGMATALWVSYGRGAPPARGEAVPAPPEAPPGLVPPPATAPQPVPEGPLAGPGRSVSPGTPPAERPKEPAGPLSPPPAAPGPQDRPLIAEFFGFPVENLDRATAPPSEPPTSARGPVAPPSPRPAPPPPKPEAVHLEAMAGRCVAGFDGTSTLHDFRGWTKSVGGWVEFLPGQVDQTARATFDVDARTLDTGDPDRDRAMHEEHLQTAKFPQMKFTLREFRSGPGGSCTIQGEIEIHGTSRPMELVGTFALRSDGILHVKGEAKAKMSDFGITPPSKVLVIRTADEIRLWFEVWAGPRERLK